MAAAPTFALMAVLTAMLPPEPMCMPVPDALPVGGMAPMYLLMSLFHSGAWLKR